MRRIKTAFVLTAVFVSVFSGYAQQVEVGKWRTHFAPSAILQLTGRGTEVFGAMNTGLAYIDTRDNALYEMNRNHGLSNTGISSVAYSALHDILLVGYLDGMLDLVYGNEVYGLADIYNKELGTGKAIYRIVPDGRYAYLATQFGVVVVDLQKEEIRETYFIGENNAYLPVYDVALDRQYLYAATAEGLKYAPRDEGNLNDYAVWTLDSLFSGKTVGIAGVWDGLAVSTGETIYAGDAESGWEVIRRLQPGREIVSAFSGDKEELVVSVLDTVSLSKRIEVLARAADGTVEVKWTIDRIPGRIQSIMADRSGKVWTGMTDGRMMCFDPVTGQSLSYPGINGPVSDQCFDLSATGRGITMARGGYNAMYAPENIPFGASVFLNETWSVYTPESIQAAGLPESVRSVTQMVEDPQQEGHFFAATSLKGVVEINPDGTMHHYHPGNSLLQNDMISHTSCRVYGLDFDAAGDLWMLNALTGKALVLRQRDGTWKSFDLRVIGYSDERPKGLLVDYWQQKWVIFHGNTLGVFKTDGNSIQGLRVNLNRGNTLETSSVFCLAEDDLGHVWIGTDRGVKVIDQHARMFENPIGNESSVSAKTIKVPTDGFLIELLNTEQVRAIAVDGGNRKWLGTASGGLYLVSADGMDEIQHFTTENSPLLSNTVIDLAIDDRTGELFIGTDKGVISYRGTATRTEGDPKEEARAFPNPVRPGYEGLINIKGLPQNAIVKITDTRGMLIYQGRATGGQLSWDGRGMQGKRPDSGVLFVFACKEDGQQKLACKIFYIR